MFNFEAKFEFWNFLLNHEKNLVKNFFLVKNIKIIFGKKFKFFSKKNFLVLLKKVL